MLINRTFFFMLLALCITTANGAQAKRDPHIGYLYPAGAQRGTTIRIVAGGQFLRGAASVCISGEGVKASVVKYCKPANFFQKEQRQLVQERLRQVRDKRLVESGIDPRQLPDRRKPKKKKPDISKKEKQGTEQVSSKKKAVKMGDHPLLHDLDNKSLKELAHIRETLFFPRQMRQRNRQLAESVVIEVTVDSRAKPGPRELRIVTKTGLTNPMVFQIGTMPQVLELEPNNKQAYQRPFNVAGLPKEKPLELPVVLNGQIMPGDIDRFRFTAKKGQRLVIETHARSLIPYLSDAVPGWFQATLALYDDKNNEVAFVDDYRFNPDPVMFYEIPKSGEYELEIRDSIYRGREDFVYRIAAGQHPFITQIFPLGGKAYSRTEVSTEGWNLSEPKFPLDTRPNDNDVQHMVCDRGGQISNPIVYAVGRLTEIAETESNNTLKEAQPVTLPVIINGRISAPGDMDVFQFKGRSGEKVVAEVYGRRLNSPVDSLLRLTTADGSTLEWNDDYTKKDGHLHKDTAGLTTHHADSYITAALPEDGTYYAHLSDSQNQGGRAYGYRLRIAEPKGDFALRITPSSLFTYTGGTVAMQVYVLRKDGFAGEIKMQLKNAPAGFKLKGARIPPGCDQIRMTLTTPHTAPAKPVSLELQGSVIISGQIVSRPAIPAEDMMQAFLYRHLVPSQQLLISIQKKKLPPPDFELIDDGPVRIATADSVPVRFKVSKRRIFRDIELELSQPPDGMTMHNVKVASGALSFTLKADSSLRSTGFVGNVIVEAFKEFKPKKKNNKNKAANKKHRISIGYLPAIPIVIANQ